MPHRGDAGRMLTSLASVSALRSPLMLVRAAEARALGLPVRSPAFHRVRPGVYADGTDWNALPGWKRYHVRVHAFLLVHPDAVLCLESAAVVLGLPYFGEPRDIHVYDPGRGASRRFGDVAVHTSDAARTIVKTAGIHVTSLTDTVVDLVRVLPPAYALAVGDAAVSAARGGPLTAGELREHEAGQANRRGGPPARGGGGGGAGATESAGESVSRAVIEWCGFEVPILQREFRYEGFRDRVDFHFPTANAIGESDGWGKYALDDPREAAARLTAEKRREDRLRRNGHGFARWDLADAQRVEPLRTALRAASVPLIGPEQQAMLATLRSSPRTLPPPGRARR